MMHAIRFKGGPRDGLRFPLGPWERPAPVFRADGVSYRVVEESAAGDWFGAFVAEPCDPLAHPKADGPSPSVIYVDELTPGPRARSLVSDGRSVVTVDHPAEWPPSDMGDILLTEGPANDGE